MTEIQIEKEALLFEHEWKAIFGIPPNTFGKVDNFYGITIEMKTKETNHIGKPHCHAKYQGQSIRISLKDFSILDSTKMDAKHQKMAVEYVKEHLDYLTYLWNKIPGVIKF